jgi:ABC-type multidrug transport system fused ATPase/permease subunit
MGDVGRCLGLLRPAERWRWAALVPVAVATAAVEALSAAAVFAIVQVVHDPAAAASIPPLRLLVGLLPAGDPDTAVSWIVALLIGLYVIRGVFLVAASYLRHAVMAASAAALADRMLAAYLATPYAFHLRRDSASLIRKLTTGVDMALRIFLASAVALATEVLIAAGIVLILVVITPLVTLVVVSAVAALMWLPVRVGRARLGRWGREHQTLVERSLRALQQSLGGVKEVTVTGSARYFHRLFADHQRALWRLYRSEGVLGDALLVAVESAGVITLALVVLVAMRARAAIDVLPVLGLYAYAAFRLVPAANRMMRHLGLMSLGRAAVQDLAEDLATLPRAAPAPAAADEIVFARAVALEAVSYAYGDGGAFELRDVDVVIRRGESVGIVGRSGAGKSTLVDLLLGLLEPTEGRVTVDGADIRGRLAAWQARIGYVPHVPFLVEGSLRENIAFGVEPDRVDAGRLATAVRLARLEEVVAALPHGLDSPAGEGGARLSDGERQRVGIARALYRDPEVLVLDEATSALDAQTEREVAAAVDVLRGTRTLIVVAHRLSTVRRCDRLVFLTDGRIGGTGSLEELLARDPAFRALAASAG